MRRWVFVLLAGACSGGGDPGCEEWDQVFVYADGDGDGFGAEGIGWQCAPEPGQAISAGDCDDQDGTAFPTAEELCDEVDNDCDGVIDDGLPLFSWFEDVDGDGFGQKSSQPSCAPPDPRWIAQGGDCDDDDPQVNPRSREVCNGIDDDCDRKADDEDDGVDPTTQSRWYRDSDRDGHGDDTAWVDACVPPGALFIARDGDCDDTRPTVNPDGEEICDLLDDDCDGLVDDADPTVDPSGQIELYVDLDLDGYGAPNATTLACRPIPGAVANDDDCDDGDPSATVVRDWFVDDDWDGVGVGQPIAHACHAPGPGTAPRITDCDDSDPFQFPGNPEICEDGLDQDCSGDDRRCATWLYTVREGDNMLRRYDALSGIFEDVGLLGVPFDFGDLAYDPDRRVMYMVDGRGGRGLYTVDLETGAASLVGTHNLSDLFGLAWDTRTGTLYASQWFPYGLYTLDPASGSPLLVGSPGLAIGALTHDSARDMLLAMNEGPGDLYEINRTNGRLSFLANQGFVNNSGMAYDPVGDMIYVIDWSGSLYAYDPNDGYLRTTLLWYMPSHDGLVYVPNPPN